MPTRHAPLACLVLVFGSSSPPRPTKLLDLDGDGLLDVSDGGSFWSMSVSLQADAIEGVPLVMHALGNDRFSKDDAVTRAGYAEHCRGVQDPPWITKEEPGLSARRISCALMYGGDAETIAQQALAEYDRLVPDPEERPWGYGREDLAELIARKPPLVLTR